jgi:hypothetical protein
MVKISLLMRLTLGYIAILVLVIALGVYVAFNLNQINLLIRGTADDGAIFPGKFREKIPYIPGSGFQKKIPGYTGPYRQGSEGR